MTITFKCGHVLTVDDVTEAPECQACGERQISNVTAPAPKFRGACSGPLVKG